MCVRAVKHARGLERGIAEDVPTGNAEGMRVLDVTPSFRQVCAALES